MPLQRLICRSIDFGLIVISLWLSDLAASFLITKAPQGLTFDERQDHEGLVSLAWYQGFWLLRRSK